MTYQTRRQSSTARQEPEPEVTTDVPAETTADADELKAEMDELLDEIDGVLEENAAAFVKSYVQAPGE